jgi:hypothetical protein
LSIWPLRPLRSENLVAVSLKTLSPPERGRWAWLFCLECVDRDGQRQIHVLVPSDEPEPVARSRPIRSGFERPALCDTMMPPSTEDDRAGRLPASANADAGGLASEAINPGVLEQRKAARAEKCSIRDHLKASTPVCVWTQLPPPARQREPRKAGDAVSVRADRRTGVRRHQADSAGAAMLLKDVGARADCQSVHPNGAFCQFGP